MVREGINKIKKNEKMEFFQISKDTPPLPAQIIDCIFLLNGKPWKTTILQQICMGNKSINKSEKQKYGLFPN